MATYTTNMGLKKPAGDENMNVGDINGNTDDIDAAITNDRKAMAIISKGNTHAAISSGQYVYVHNHSTLPDGLYKATSAISANGSLSTSNLSSVSSGGFNDVLTLLSAKVNTTDRVVVDRNINTSLADCNEITDPGMYRLINTTQNRPNTISYGVLLHIIANDYITQLVINTAGSVMAIRGRSSGIWNDWKTIPLGVDATLPITLTNTSTYGSLTAKYVKHGNIVSVHAEYTPNTTITSSSGIIGTLPIGYRPIGGKILVRSSDKSIDSSSETLDWVRYAALESNGKIVFRGPYTSGNTYTADFAFVVS